MHIEDNALYTDLQVAEMLGRARSTLQKDRVKGGGVPFVKVGRHARYRGSDVKAFIAALTPVSSTSEL